MTMHYMCLLTLSSATSASTKGSCLELMAAWMRVILNTAAEPNCHPGTPGHSAGGEVWTPPANMVI